MFWLKLIIGPMVAEISAILTLVAVVAIFGPDNYEAAQAYAERLGYWVGPIAGVSFSFLGGFWIARPLARGQVGLGALFGLVAGAIDVTLLVAMQAPFEWVFVVSNGGKVLAAAAGGFLASSLPRKEQTAHE